MAGNVRVNRLRQMMERRGLAAMLVSGTHNRRYLSGFTGSAGVLLITEQRQTIATDFRYYEQALAQSPGWQLFRVGYDFDGQLPALLDALGAHGRPIGYEAAHVTVDRMSHWQAALGEDVPLSGTLGLVEGLRAIKDDGELAAIRRAVSIADRAWAELLDQLRPGLLEREVAWQLESAMRRLGASAVAFDLMVASGPNSALPHARAGERAIQAGEPLVMDFGCVVDGYRSDITRTVCLGHPSDGRYMEIWNLVQRAQEAALAGLRGGLSGVEADSLARNVIAAAGYADFFGHGLGHGIGLAAHELPRLSFACAEPVPARAVVSIEPGIYLPGWGGVRIEDLVLVRAVGVEVLTQAAKSPVLE